MLCRVTGICFARILPCAIALFAFLLLFTSFSPHAFAQDVSGDDAVPDLDFSQLGALQPKPEDLAAIPSTPVYRSFLPERADLSRQLPQPGNQGRQGSCVGWAVAYAARAYYVSAREGRNNRVYANIPSPAYVYNSILERGKSCGEGSFIRDAMQLLKRGALSYSEYPYNSNACYPPNSAQQSRATDFRIDDFRRVNLDDGLDQVKGELARGNPVVIGMRVSQAFKDHRGSHTLRAAYGPEGNHAIAVVGYDDRLQAFRIINSWGREWGDGGYAWISYSLFKQKVFEAYVMILDTIAPPKPEPAPPVVVVPPKPEPKPPVVVVPPKPEPKPEPPVVVVPPKPEPKPLPVVPLPQDACARVHVSEANGKQILTGFYDKPEQLELLKKNFPAAEIRVEQRQWPQCEALITLEKALSSSDGMKTVVRRPATGAYAQGEQLVFEIETPDYPSYVHAAYIQADGSVVHLVQQGAGELKAYAPRTKLVLGEAGKGQTFRVSAPYGREMLVVLAGKAPVFPDARPRQETEREFLTALRAALIAKINPTDPDREISAAFDAIVTVGKPNP